METGDLVDALALEGARMTAAAAAVDPDAPVPTCPEWVARDLVRHTGGVHRWATAIVATPHTEPWLVELDDVVGSWPADEALGGWFETGQAALVATLGAAPADLECFTFLAAASPLDHWARRQAHETAIHRVDTELTAGRALSPIEPVFAADGVDELLVAFVPRRSTRVRADEPTTLGIACSDTDGTWLLRIDREGVTTVAGPAVDVEAADCTATGRAVDLYLALWNRTDPALLAVEGDGRVLDDFLDSFHVRWS